MNNIDLLALFFKAENERNWDLYRKFLHPEIVWHLFDREQKVIIGIEDYVKTIKSAYKYTDVQFSCINTQVSSDGNRICAHLINDLGSRSLDIFTLRMDYCIENMSLFLTDRILCSEEICDELTYYPCLNPSSSKNIRPLPLT